ncbi:GNAT family N-acetyltransferase [Candidatus Bathyarchaeota archaeon]|nr:GNAT family N-acetyltransferase [Candidatus Bathyarchaeota archaeon]
MYKILEVNDGNRWQAVKLLIADAVRNVFAIYDLKNEFENTEMHIAFKDEALKGYILIYRGMRVPSVILEGEENAAEALLKYAPKDRFIMHLPKRLLPIAQRKFQNAKFYVEDWMLVKKEQARFFKASNVRRLSSLKDAEKLAKLFSTVEKEARKAFEDYVKLISKAPVYGVFIKDMLVSCAGSRIQLPEVWLIGGVYTHPEYRNRGYATLATSAITEEALSKADSAALLVRSDNHPAIRVYEKIGYRKVFEKIWMDVGTGLMP